MAIALRENSLTDLDDPPWMFGNSQVVWASPQREAPAGPPPRPEDLDRVVHETMVDKLTERVHLQRRVDVVYHGGEPEASESCGVAMRALWAVPLVLAANGLKRVAKPLAGCCSVGRVPPERLAAPGATEAPQSDAPLPDAPAAAVAVEAGGGPAAAEAPAAAAPSIDAAAATPAVSSSALPGAPEAAAAPGQPAEAAAAAQGVKAEVPATVGVAADAEGTALPAKPEVKRPRGGGSMASMASTMQSPAGNLLAGLAMKGGSGGGRSRPGKSSGADGASVIGGQATSASPAAPSAPSSSSAPPSRASPAVSAPSTPAVPAVPTVATGERTPVAPGSSGQTPASNSTAQEPKKRPEGGAEPSGERRRRERDPNQSASKTVVSNFQSNSAASNLLGPMVARAGKKQGRKGDSDAKSAVG